MTMLTHTKQYKYHLQEHDFRQVPASVFNEMGIQSWRSTREKCRYDISATFFTIGALCEISAEWNM